MHRLSEKFAEVEALFNGLPDIIQTANETLDVLCNSKDDFEAARSYINNYADKGNVSALKIWALHYIKILEYLSNDTGVAAVVAEKLSDRLDGFIKEGRKKLKELEFKFDGGYSSLDETASPEVQPDKDLLL